MTICKFQSIVISPSRTTHSWLLPMVCVPWRDPRVNIWSAQEDQDLSVGHTFHTCEAINLDPVFQNVISFLLCYCCFGLWVPTSHTFHEIPLKEGVYDWGEKRKKASHLPAWWWTICFRHSLFLPQSSPQGRRLWLRWRKEESLPFPSLMVNYSFSLFLYLNLRLGVVAVPKEILISKSGVVKTLWIRSDRRKLHTCSSKKKKK